MQNQLITQTTSRQFQSAIVNNHAEHPDSCFIGFEQVHSRFLGFEQVHSCFSFFQLGVALGFVIPVSVVTNQKAEENIHLIGKDLFNMFLVVAIITSILLLVIVIGKRIWVSLTKKYYRIPPKKDGKRVQKIPKPCKNHVLYIQVILIVFPPEQ